MNAGAEQSPKDLAGKRVGRYVLLRHLDTGGMAEIFLGRHEGPGGFRKDLVIKMLQPRYAENQQVLEMFRDEARLAAKLDHPSIVEVFDVGVEEGTHYIAMEHIEGKTLTDVIRRGIEVGKPMPLPYVAYVLGQVADGLAYMWEGRDAEGTAFRIVHRDISPTNVIISTSGQSRIIDFGIATDRAARKDEESGRPGKYSYMSPEQVKGQTVDGRSDIFSLGIILYEITLGKRLYRGQPQVVMKRIVEEAVRPPTFERQDYPPSLELVVLRALEKNPDDRYQSAAELARDLETFIGEMGTRVTNRHIAEYLATIESPDAQISEKGRRRAAAFIEGDDELPEEPLDLDFKAREEWKHGPAAEEPKAPPEKPVPKAPPAPTPAPPPVVEVTAPKKGAPAALTFVLGALAGAGIAFVFLRALAG